MPSFVFQVGSLDLSQYVRVAPGDGLDPYGSDGFLDPTFQGSASLEGEALTGVAVKNRQQTWPIFFKGADKDALHQLVISFHRELAAAAGKPLIAWRDAGATQTSYYDSEFVRFDPDFNFRRAEHGYLAGKITVWTQPPFAHTNTTRTVGGGGVGTALGQAGVFAPTLVASALQGDVDGLAYVTIVADSTATNPLPGPAGRAVALARLPHASHQPFWPAASLTRLGMGTLYGASGAPASQVISGGRFGPTGPPHWGVRPGAQLNLRSDVYAGRQRILAAVRPGMPDGMYVSAINAAGDMLSPTALVECFRDGFKLVDLGVLSVPTSVPTSSLLLSWGLTNRAQNGQVGMANGRWAGDLGAIYVLPEDTLALHVDEIVRPVAGGWMSATGMSAATGVPWSDSYGNQFNVAGGPSSGGFILNGAGLLSARSESLIWSQVDPLQDLRAEALVDCTTDTVGTGLSQVSLGKYNPDLSALAVVVAQAGLQQNGSGAYLTITAGGWGIGSIVASRALGATLMPHGSRIGHLEVVVRGPEAYANWHTIDQVATSNAGITSPVACVGLATTAIIGMGPGQPYLGMTATAQRVALPYLRWDRLLGRSDLSDNYIFDGINDSLTFLSGLTNDNQDRTQSLRGQIPKAPPGPTAARFATVLGWLDGGPMNTGYTATIDVRERWFLAR